MHRDRRGFELGAEQFVGGVGAQAPLDPGGEPDGHARPARGGDKTAGDPPIHMGRDGALLGNIPGGEVARGAFGQAMQDSVRETGGMGRLGAHELDALAHGGLRWRAQVHELERRDPQGKPHARGDLPGFGDMEVERLVQAAPARGHAEREPAGEAGVPRIERGDRPRMVEHVAHVGAVARRRRERAQRGLACRGEPCRHGA